MMKLVKLTVTVVLLTSGVLSAASKQDEIVAATLIAEAGGERGTKGMEAVNEVIHNRSVKRKISKAEVCLQKWQFSCWNGVSVESGIAKAKKHPKWSEALRIATSSNITNHTNGADHYHTIQVNPSWNKKLKKTVTVQNHIFYR